MTVVMVLSLLTVSPFAASEVVKLSADAGSYKQGEKVTVKINFNSVFRSAAALDVCLKYDSSQLEIYSVTNGDAIKNARDKQSGNVYDVFSESHSKPGEVKWVFAGSKNYEFKGLFATVVFTVGSNAKNGNTTLNFVVNDAVSAGFENVASSLTSNALTLGIVRSAESDMRFKSTADGSAYIITAYGSVGRDTVEIPSYHYDKPVVGIAGGAFSGHSEIKNVVFSEPYMLETIEANAFSNCTGLETIAIADSVTAIGEGAFSGCTSLANLELSLSLTAIGKDAFKNCESLAGVRLPFNLTDIGATAFDGCSALNAIYISKNTVNIDNTAFTNIAAEKTIYTVEGNTVIDEYNTTSGLNATVSKTLKDISLGTASAVETAKLVRGGVEPEVTVELTDLTPVSHGTDYKIVYLNNHFEGKAKVLVAGINGYGEGYNVEFNVVCEHDWAKTVAKAPTCTEKGTYDLKCKICDKDGTEDIPPAGHSANTWIVDKRPTITSTGLQHKVCIVCHTKYETGTVLPKIVPDADRDGNVNSTDALIILQYTVGLDNVLTKDTLKLVDCNGDGKVNSVDALTVLRITVGEIVLEA